MYSYHDKRVVRELAKKYMELVCTDGQRKMRQRFCDTNDLKIVRPPVLIDEIPWYQMDIDGELTCVCEEKDTQNAELYFRKAIYYMKHFKADNNYEPFFRVKRAVDSTGIGVRMKTSDVKRTDNKTI